ncbi:hypothetical protein FB451DRAFT_1162041 [Mycena latifolia]|nr:hypothetical protein FB451DRAFT_1162041 [Mycena latifolia]
MSPVALLYGLPHSGSPPTCSLPPLPTETTAVKCAQIPPCAPEGVAPGPHAPGRLHFRSPGSPPSRSHIHSMYGWVRLAYRAGFFFDAVNEWWPILARSWVGLLSGSFDPKRGEGYPAGSPWSRRVHFFLIKTFLAARSRLSPIQGKYWFFFPRRRPLIALTDRRDVANPNEGPDGRVSSSFPPSSIMLPSIDYSLSSKARSNANQPTKGHRPPTAFQLDLQYSRKVPFSYRICVDVSQQVSSGVLVRKRLTFPTVLLFPVRLPRLARTGSALRDCVPVIYSRCGMPMTGVSPGDNKLGSEIFEFERVILGCAFGFRGYTTVNTLGSGGIRVRDGSH